MDEEATIVLSGIGKELNDGMLMNIYRSYGPIVRIRHNGSNSANVVFQQKRHALNAVQATNGSIVGGKTLKVMLQPPFRKTTEPCRGFAAGICRKGDMCKYFHGMEYRSSSAPQIPPIVATAPRESKETVPPSATSTEIPPEIQAIPERKLCRHFRRGHCSLGATCTFAHVLGLPKPVVKSKKPCSFFQDGRCTRGDTCRFVHESGGASVAQVQSSPPVADSQRAHIGKKKSQDKVASSQKQAENRTCTECDEPNTAKWQCANCDDALYCDKCNSVVHEARVMAKHERVQLLPLKKVPRCGECEEKTSSVRCEQCDMSFCASCDVSVHKFKSLQKHDRVPLASGGGNAASKTTTRKKEAKATENGNASVTYTPSIPQVEFSSDSASSEDEDEEKEEASSVESEYEKPEPVNTLSRSNSEDEFDDEKAPTSVMYSESVPKMEFSSDSDDDSDNSDDENAATARSAAVSSESEGESEDEASSKRTVTSKPTRKPSRRNTSNESESGSESDDTTSMRSAGDSDDESSHSTLASGSAPSEAASSEVDDESEVETPSKKATAKVKSTSSGKVNTSSGSECSSDDKVSLKKTGKKSTKRAAKASKEFSSESSDSSGDEASVKKKSKGNKTSTKPAKKATDKKKVDSTSTVEKKKKSTSKATSSSKDKTTSAGRAAKLDRAPTSTHTDKAESISKGSSHSLVKKIETFNESSEVGELHLDANLNGFERLLAHDCADRLGLVHESVGSGLERHIIISRPGRKKKRPAADSSNGSKSKKTKHRHI